MDPNHLTFPSLPQNLKNSIINQIDVTDALNLLQVNQELRKKILLKGPFPKNVEEIRLNPQYEKEFHLYDEEERNLPFPRFKLGISTRESHSFVYDFKILHIKNHKKLHISGKTIWLLVKRFENVKSMKITLIRKIPDDCKNREWLLGEYRKLLKFLPRPHFLERFEISYNFQLTKLVFENFESKILELCHFRVFIDNEDRREAYGYFMDFMGNEKFVDCKILKLNRQREPSWEALTKTNVELLLYVTDFDRLAEYLQVLFDKGIPSKFPNRAAGLFAEKLKSKESKKVFDQFLRKLLSSTPGLKRMGEFSNKAKNLLENFQRWNKNLIDLGFHNISSVADGEFLENHFYRQRIDEGKELHCVVSYFESVIDSSFYTQVLLKYVDE